MATIEFQEFCGGGPASCTIIRVLLPETQVQFVKGIGPRLAEGLAERGILCVEDLLYHLPFRYEDRLNPRAIADLQAGETASLIAEVRTSGLFRTRGNLGIFQMTAGQELKTIQCLWFHGEYLKDRFRPGQKVALYGKVEESTFGRGGLQIIQPQYEILNESSADENGELFSLETGRIVPIYEAVGKLTTRWMRRVIYKALEELSPEIEEALPQALCERLGLLSRREAFQQVHWPGQSTPLNDLHYARTPAHRRLIFEELFFLELGLELKRRKMRKQNGIRFQVGDRERAAIKRILPFHPTAAQKRVFGEMAAEMAAPSPMRRLLQGDVGSGKTIVAFEAAILAIENGCQVALMAPTEILATQHYLAARRILEKAGYRIVLLTGSLDETSKGSVRYHIAKGDAQLVIGTHALLQDKVEYRRLGLVIVDEQHRFGVMQRMKLMKKNAAEQPDVLVMTATPIPRTLALTIYGDLDSSVIDELPPGRTPVTTRRLSGERAEELWTFVRKVVAEGRQAYVVYPVIEEGKQGPELKAAVQMYDELRRKWLKPLRVGLLHGRMSAAEKDDVMRRFQGHELDVLVSTTVIEVGVDVPNAALMVIEHAERFGLSQLHQLRGRIGRGAAKSYCLLVTGGKLTPEAVQRLDTMVATSDGFEIAEKDLELRGPGEFFGTKQSGLPSLRVANLLRDRQLLELAKQEARWLVEHGPETISTDELHKTYKHLQRHWNRRYGLVEAG
jgi:ATP-dependent DNA helicase RecG